MTQFVFSQQSSVPRKPLNDDEKRLVLRQLLELEDARSKILQYEDWIKREQELDAREKAVAQQELENAKKATELTKQELALAQEQTKFYKDLYETVIKKPHGAGCTIAKIFTLGIYRCK